LRILYVTVYSIDKSSGIVHNVVSFYKWFYFWHEDYYYVNDHQHRMERKFFYNNNFSNNWDMIGSLSETSIVLSTLVCYAVKWENQTDRFVICGH
jgi:hypothetical protein